MGIMSTGMYAEAQTAVR